MVAEPPYSLMNKIVDFFLRSVMAAIMAVAAIVAGALTFPFLLLFWIFKQLRELIK